MVDIRVLCSLYVSNQNSVFVMSVKQVSIPDLNVLRSGDGCGCFLGHSGVHRARIPVLGTKALKF